MHTDEIILEDYADGKTVQMMAEFALQLKTLTTQQAQMERSLTRQFQALMEKIDVQSSRCVTVEEPCPLEGESSQDPVKQANSRVEIDSASHAKTFLKIHTRLQLEDCGGDQEAEVPKHIWTERLRGFVKSNTFEAIVGSVILANMLCMGIRVQLEGMGLETSLGFGSGGGQYSHAITALANAEVILVGMYWIEMGLRAWAMGAAFFRSVPLLYELCAVLFGTLDVFAESASIDLGPKIGPILRMTRALRLAKIIRVMSAFPELNVFLSTIKKSAAPLGWGMLVLFVIMGVASLLMAQLFREFIEDESKDPSLRRWAYDHFSTTAGSMLTMLESTFSPKWLTILRTLATQISWWQAAMWLVYGILINFAGIRLVASLFVKSAMSADRNEQQRAAMAKRAEMQRNASTIYRMFKAMDTSGDGKLQRSELEDFLRQDSTEKSAFFTSVDLTEDEALAIFNLASSDCDEIDFEEFITMAMSIRNPVQNIDTMRILHEQGKLRKDMAAVNHQMRQLLESIGHRRQPRRKTVYKVDV